jgi:hypothetical protein
MVPLDRECARTVSGVFARSEGTYVLRFTDYKGGWGREQDYQVWNRDSQV